MPIGVVSERRKERKLEKAVEKYLQKLKSEHGDRQQELCRELIQAIHDLIGEIDTILKKVEAYEQPIEQKFLEQLKFLKEIVAREVGTNSHLYKKILQLVGKFIDKTLAVTEQSEKDVERTLYRPSAGVFERFTTERGNLRKIVRLSRRVGKKQEESTNRARELATILGHAKETSTFNMPSQVSGISEETKQALKSSEEIIERVKAYLKVLEKELDWFYDDKLRRSFIEVEEVRKLKRLQVLASLVEKINEDKDLKFKLEEFKKVINDFLERIKKYELQDFKDSKSEEEVLKEIAVVVEEKDSSGAVEYKKGRISWLNDAKLYLHCESTALLIAWAKLHPGENRNFNRYYEKIMVGRATGEEYFGGKKFDEQVAAKILGLKLRKISYSQVFSIYDRDQNALVMIPSDMGLMISDSAEAAWLRAKIPGGLQHWMLLYGKVRGMFKIIHGLDNVPAVMLGDEALIHEFRGTFGNFIHVKKEAVKTKDEILPTLRDKNYLVTKS